MTYKKSKIAIFIASLLSFIAAAIITLEKIELLVNPSHIPSCSINPFISCGPIMESWQASLFLLPNPVLGMVGFALLCFITFLSLFIKLPKWVWLSTFIGVSLAFVFIIWLISQSLFVIGALCVYCIFVWTMMTLIFWLIFSMTVKKLGWINLIFVVKYKVALITTSYMVIATLIFLAFSDNWLLLLK
jgi:uncharacterized membrane protein